MNRTLTNTLLAGLLLTACASGEAQPERQRAIGCLEDLIYNVQSPSRQGLSFTLRQGSDSHRFNFEADAIRFIPPSGPLPIASTEEVEQYETLLESLENAAIAGKPVMVDYAMPSREVFGVRIMWSESCPTT